MLTLADLFLLAFFFIVLPWPAVLRLNIVIAPVLLVFVVSTIIKTRARYLSVFLAVIIALAVLYFNFMMLFGNQIAHLFSKDSHAQPPGYTQVRSQNYVDSLAALPQETRAVSKLAVVNKEVFMKVPCYCGCVAVQHRNLSDCFVAPAKQSKTSAVLYNVHGASCRTCIDEANLIGDLLKKSKSVLQIRRAIDRDFSYRGEQTKI